MDSEETVIWAPPSHRIITLVIGLALTSAAVYLLSTEELSGIGLLFVLTFSVGSLGCLLYALRLVVAPKPTLVFDSTGLSNSRLTTKTPWDQVDKIERVVVGGYGGSTSHGIAISLIENSDYKSDLARSVFDWDRKEKYDIVIWKQHCDVPLDELQQRLLKFKEGFSETAGGG